MAVLTDNGIQFTLPPRYARGGTDGEIHDAHVQICVARENGIEHRLTKIKSNT